MRSKLSTTLLWVILLAAAITGCDDPGSNESKQPTGEPTKAEPAPEPIKLSYDLITPKLIALGQTHREGLQSITQALPSDFLKRQKQRSGSLKALLEGIYPAGNPTFRFISEGLAGEGVQAMLKHLDELPSHGLKTTYFPVEKTLEAVSQVEVIENQLVALDGDASNPHLPKLRNVLKA